MVQGQLFSEKNYNKNDVFLSCADDEWQMAVLRIIVKDVIFIYILELFLSLKSGFKAYLCF